jgi:Na+-transporting NADH:ubiquinone oxidoreductase subunit NqrB
MARTMLARLALPEVRLPTLPQDPRILQIAFLGSFLLAGLTFLEFELRPWQPPVILATACATQWAMTRLYRVPDAGYRSVLISSLGLSLLLRSDVLWVPPLAAFIAIASKFVIRVRGKHVFNPTNLGLAACLFLTPHAWSSPSQWGESAGLIAWFGIFGLSVAHRAFRSDVSLAFLASWVALKMARVLYLGQRPEVLLHQLNVGSLILFAFFMISDPKTTPDRRSARIAFAAAVAGLAFVLQHSFWWYNALIWALVLLSTVVPLIDRLLPSDRYHWPTERKPACPPQSVPLPSP